MPSLDGICLDGFSEPITIDELRRTRYAGLPEIPGIYVIIRSSDRRPRFLLNSTGGWFKGKDPSYPYEVVCDSWVEAAHVMYVGMTKARKGLKSRLGAFFDFGSGKRRGHRGGRLLWHLEDSEKLLVRWRTCPGVEAYPSETAAIARFKAVYNGKRPYANRNK